MGEALLMNHRRKKKSEGLKYYDTLTTIGASETIDGAVYNEAGYFGTVSASELFTGTELAALVGITQGTSQFSDTEWLKFYIDGKIIFTPAKVIRHSISWNDINIAKCVSGDLIISKNDTAFKVRLFRGSLRNPALLDRTDMDSPNSEWNRLMLPIHEYSLSKKWRYPERVESFLPNWNIGFDNVYLGAAVRSWCQEKNKSNTNQSLVRGGGGTTDSGTIEYGGGSSSTNRYNHTGWRPVLEVVSPEELEGGN